MMTAGTRGALDGQAPMHAGRPEMYTITLRVTEPEGGKKPFWFTKEEIEIQKQ